MNLLNIYIAILSDKEILFKALKIALIVGTLLNIINQGEVIFSLNFENINYVKSILTYLVPFLVSTYTAVTMKLKFKMGEITHFDVTLICKNCKKVLDVHKNEPIPFCIKCKEKTKWSIK